jgi:transglutaminase superfamily protein
LNPTMEIWRRFWRLSGPERLAVLEAAAGLAITRMGLRLAGFRRWKTVVEMFARASAAVSGAKGDANAEAGREVARMMAAAARYVPLRTNCLEQSLVLWWLLERRGIPAVLKIGARKEASRFEAHAWVEFEGGVPGGPGEEHLHFVPFEGLVTSMETRTN